MRIQFIFFILILPITVFLAFSIFPASQAGEILQLSMSFDKSEYKKTDPKYVNFNLKNKGENPIYVNKRFFINSEDAPEGQREIFLTATSPSGEKVRCNISYETGFPKIDYFVLLEPGGEVSTERNMNVSNYFDFKETGTYDLVAVYHNVYGDEIGIDAFKGKIASKPVKIKIVE